MICNKCEVTTNVLIDGLCPICRENQFQVKFNYECPDCKGRFNCPEYNEGPSTTFGNSCCPFCGRIMEGMNQ